MAFDECIEQSLRIPAAPRGESLGLDGIIGDPASSLLQLHQSPCCLPAGSSQLENLGERLGEPGHRVADGRLPALFSHGVGLGPTRQVEIIYATLARSWGKTATWSSKWSSHCVRKAVQ